MISDSLQPVTKTERSRVLSSEIWKAKPYVITGVGGHHGLPLNKWKLYTFQEAVAFAST